MKRSLITAFIFFIQMSLYAQLPNGSLAPDFTLTDYNGNVHRLNDYLNDGKTVILEIFAAHCPICWNFHQTNRLKNLYQSYGPEGTDELMVLALEYDQWNNHNAFIGIGEPWVTQGNWLDGTPYPIFNVEDPNRGVFDDYNIVGYPQVYKICPDGILEVISTSQTESQIYNKVQQCQLALSADDVSSSKEMYLNSSTKTVSFNAGGKPWTLNIWNLQGQLINSISSINSSSIQLDQLITGVYLFEIRMEDSSFTKRMFWH